MSERGIEVKVGVLVITCMALLGMFLVLLGDYSTTERGDLFIDVPTSANLKPGAPVKIAGVLSGKVAAVEYMGGEVDEEVGRRVFVRVHMKVDAQKIVTLHTDAIFYITTQGVLGEKYVEIDPGSLDRPNLNSGDILIGDPPLRLEIMAHNANRLLSSLARIVRDNEDTLDEILTETAKLVKTARSATERVDRLLADNEAKVGEVLDELIALERNASTLIASAQTALGDGKDVNRTVTEVQKLAREVRTQISPVIADVRSTLKRYRDLADSGVETIAETKGKLGNLLSKGETAVSEVATLVSDTRKGKTSLGALLNDTEIYDDVREMLKDLKRHPWKFLWKE
jgi:phospholipid/cholesterol/gamma-HCH transport system substrate-binding protein